MNENQVQGYEYSSLSAKVKRRSSKYDMKQHRKGLPFFGWNHSRPQEKFIHIW